MGQQQSSPNSVGSVQPGDHIYSERIGGLYSHHGIYVGNNMVIHFGMEHLFSKTPCCDCGYNGGGGVVKTCLKCFLDGGSLLKYEYGVSLFDIDKRLRGSCSSFDSKPASEVIQTAFYFLATGFGIYNLVLCNCEHFAVCCKTGLPVSKQVLVATALAVALA